MTSKCSHQISRRSWMATAASGIWWGASNYPLLGGTESPPRGVIVGEPTAERVGLRCFAEGGNAFDAIVAAAFAGAIAAPHQTGIGGYGGSAILYHAQSRTIHGIDFNSVAPAAATRDMFAAPGFPPAKMKFGWLAAGTPGVMAGLELVARKYGTRPFTELLQPAIGLTRDGFPLDKSLANLIRIGCPEFKTDPGSLALYYPQGKTLAAGEKFRNPDLAEVLTTLAQRGSAESFYRGDIALRIAEGFQKQGGLVTVADLAAYQPRVVQPITIQVGAYTLHTLPPPVGGLTTLQALHALQYLSPDVFSHETTRVHAEIETLRIAWRDRLTLLGDPDFTNVPVTKLLSQEYAQQTAAQVTTAVTSKQILEHQLTPQTQGGTINLTAADEAGNYIALTLTHGEGFGARVTVPGLGLTLGHGMSRFDPRADHPNSPGPRKRPLHNMCPVLVTKQGDPIAVIGGAGGRRIPNAVYFTLANALFHHKTWRDSLAAPRIHTEGDRKLLVESHAPKAEQSAIQTLGYSVQAGSCATLGLAFREGTKLVAIRR